MKFIEGFFVGCSIRLSCGYLQINSATKELGQRLFDTAFPDGTAFDAVLRVDIEDVAALDPVGDTDAVRLHIPFQVIVIESMRGVGEADKNLGGFWRSCRADAHTFFRRNDELSPDGMKPVRVEKRILNRCSWTAADGSTQKRQPCIRSASVLRFLRVPKVFEASSVSGSELEGSGVVSVSKLKPSTFVCK